MIPFPFVKLSVMFKFNCWKMTENLAQWCGTFMHKQITIIMFNSVNV